MDRKTLYGEVSTFYEVPILKAKRCSTGKTLTGETFCEVFLHVGLCNDTLSTA